MRALAAIRLAELIGRERANRDYRPPATPLRRAVLRKAQSKDVADLPATDAYRAAIADLSATLTGSNVEAARSALRGLVGNVSVFAEGRKLYGRSGLNPAPLLRLVSIRS